MRRFVIQFIVLIFCSSSFANEAKKVMIIPVDKIDNQKIYSSKDLQRIFNSYLESYDGKTFWRSSATSAGSISPEALTGVYLPQVAGFENSSSSSLDLICYRCGLGKSELVDRADCEKYKFKWEIKNMTELKSSCN